MPVLSRKRRRIAVVTGTRAEYGLLRSTMQAINTRPGCTLQVVATGMHLLPKFGHTVDEIIADGWRIDARIRMQKGDDDPVDQAHGLARGVRGIASFLNKAKTDIVVVLGDRIEAMAGALAAVTTGKLVAHLHGGDIAPGDFDENLRHAITKLAHLHLTATEGARRRVVRMGEDPKRVHWVGAPGLDRLRELIRKSRSNSDRPDGVLIVQHPCGRSAEHEKRVMIAILRATADAGLDRTVVFPNSDRGHRGIVEAISNHQRTANGRSMRVVRSLDRDDYLRLLIDSRVLVGNSSSGIIEAPAAATIAVNVGSRQDGREHDRRFIVSAKETLDSIRNALQKALRKRTTTAANILHGNKPTGPQVVRLLDQVPLDGRFHRKCH